MQTEAQQSAPNQSNGLELPDMRKEPQQVNSLEGEGDQGEYPVDIETIMKNKEPALGALKAKSVDPSGSEIIGVGYEKNSNEVAL